MNTMAHKMQSIGEAQMQANPPHAIKEKLHDLRALVMELPVDLRPKVPLDSLTVDELTTYLNIHGEQFRKRALALEHKIHNIQNISSAGSGAPLAVGSTGLTTHRADKTKDTSTTSNNAHNKPTKVTKPPKPPKKVVKKAIKKVNKTNKPSVKTVKSQYTAKQVHDIAIQVATKIATEFSKKLKMPTKKQQRRV
jgi:hypothetical protein